MLVALCPHRGTSGGRCWPWGRAELPEVWATPTRAKNRKAFSGVGLLLLYLSGDTAHHSTVPSPAPMWSQASNPGPQKQEVCAVPAQLSPAPQALLIAS